MEHVDPSIRPTYTPAQLSQYYDRISLPQKYRASPVLAAPSPEAANTPEGLEILGKIIRYQQSSIPFENLELHYSSHHTISLDHEHLFHKMIARNNGRGGYCMENTNILAVVLRSLGYRVMSTGARVNEAVQPVSAGQSWTGPKYDGFNHMINIVTIQDTKYLVDCGFGSNSPTFPVPLTNDFTALNILPSHSMHLTHAHIPDNTARNPEQRLWIYHIRYADTSPYMPAYCFSEIEFLPNDFRTMNFFVSRSPTSWFTYSVVCLKMLMDRETEEIVGDVTLFGTEIKERRKGQSKELMEIKSEEDRVLALERFLGITLSLVEKKGVKGMVSAVV